MMVNFKKIKEEKMSKNKNSKKHFALNSHYIVIIPFFIIMILFGTACAMENDIWLATAFYIFSLVPIFCLCISPIYYIFTDKSVIIIYCFGIKEIINWSDIRIASKHGSWWFDRSMPAYRLAYPQIKKRLFFVNGEISYSRKTAKYIKQFYKKKIEDYS